MAKAKQKKSLVDVVNQSPGNSEEKLVMSHKPLADRLCRNQDKAKTVSEFIFAAIFYTKQCLFCAALKV